MAYFLSCYEGSDGGYLVLVQGAAVATIALASFGFLFFRKSRHESQIRSRIARGECVRCGYPLGTLDRCSECGCAASPRNEQA
jgi:hypothetical protein